MPKLEVIKTIEARKLNKRTRLALAEPPVTIPYGAILENIVENRDMLEFHYLGELYQCKGEVLRSASHAMDNGPASTATGAVFGAAAATAAEPVTFAWERLKSGSMPTYRARVPGGWLIACGDSGSRGVTFYPDADHAWDGTTV